jgi:hypothetical protein
MENNESLNTCLNNAIYNAAFALVDSDAQMEFFKNIDELEEYFFNKLNTENEKLTVPEDTYMMVVKLIMYQRMIKYMKYAGETLNKFMEKDL